MQVSTPGKGIATSYQLNQYTNKGITTPKRHRLLVAELGISHVHIPMHATNNPNRIIQIIS
jgi:hypothetical protein